MQTKAWYQSRVVWVNLITTIILILGLLSAALSTAPMPIPEWVPWAIGIAVAVLNVILRVWFTDTGIDSAAAKSIKESAAK